MDMIILKNTGHKIKNRSIQVKIYMIFSFILIGITSCTYEKSENFVVFEKLIVQIDPFISIKDTLKISPNGKRVAYMAKSSDRWFVVVDGKEEKQYDGILQDSLIFSPDSKHVAYASQLSNKLIAVVDGKEGKQYDNLSSIIFSPDSKRVAYQAKSGDKQFVVVDGKEEKQYDVIVGGKIIFDTPVRLYYLALKGNSIYMVEKIWKKRLKLL